MPIPTSVAEPDRLAALDAYEILDTAPEAGFDDIAHLASVLCATPIALVSLVASTRQWFKAKVGLEACETDLNRSVCAHVLAEPDLLIIPDLTKDERTKTNPLVIGELNIRFYAGAPLRTPDGPVLGALCVIDTVPRPQGLTTAQADNLRRLARQVMTQMELRRAAMIRAEQDVRHRQIVDSAVDYGIITLDLDGVITSWNSGATRILGWNEDEARGRSAAIFFTPEDVADGTLRQEMDGARRDGRADDERWHLRMDGTRFWATGEMMPLRDHRGRQIGYVKLLRDRTLEHHAGVALEESEARLRRAQAAGGIGLFSVDIETHEVTATPEFFRLYGMPATNGIRAERLEQLILPDDAAFATTVQLRNLRAAPGPTEYRIRRADTSDLRHLARKGDIEHDETGKPLRYVGVIRDITDQVAARQALRESEQRYRTLFNSMDEGFCIIEFFDGPHGPLSDYIHVEANPAYALHAGIPDIVGQKVREMVPDEADGWIELYGNVLRTGQSIRFERELLATGRYLELAAFRVEPASRRQVAVLFLDITPRKRAEAALQKLNETLEQRVASEVAERAKTEEALRQSQKMEAVGQLTGGIAHDFNNLLTGISGSLELLQTKVSQGRVTEVDRYVTAAQGAARRAAALTHRLLAFSRRQTLDPKPTDSNRLVTGMEELIRRTVGPSVGFEVVTAGGLWTVLIDPPQLENALLNLCINARDAMPHGGRITIETANKWLDEHAARERDLPPGQYVSICVTDTGTGMTADVIAKAFDPFFTTKPLGQGTGLGLSMIYGFVRQSGGQVRVYSEIDVGTTMCLYLPRHYGDEEAVPMESEAGQADRAEAGETVLVVDDEPTVRMLVTEVLEELGYTAVEAADGPSGLRVLQSDIRIDLLVTDVGLPGGMNGRQLADAARLTRPELKVLFITGYAENSVIGNGHLAPGMQVLTKPFVIETLAGRIREMIAR